MAVQQGMAGSLFVYVLSIGYVFFGTDPEGAANAANLTFLVWSDPHFDTYNESNQRLDCVNDMNRLPGRAYPAAVGGFVDTPAFVLVPGDIADNGLARQWRNDDGNANNDFETCAAGLRYPFYVLLGNHDVAENDSSDFVVARHGERYYSFDYQGVHFVGLDVVGGKPQLPQAELEWLQRDLAALAPGTAVILFFHYDPDIDNNWPALREVLAGHNVLVILHGHTHAVYKTVWYGYDVYSTGQNTLAGAGNEGFTVVRVTDTELVCVEYNWKDDRWYEDPGKVLRKPITGLPRTPAPPTPTPTLPVCLGSNILANGAMETFGGTSPLEVAAGWTARNLDHAVFRRAAGMRGKGHGQAIERQGSYRDSGAGDLYQIVEVVPGHRYALLAWVRPENGGDGSPPQGFAPDTAALQYGIGLDPLGTTSFDGLPSHRKLLHDTSEPGWGNLGWYPMSLETTAIGNRMTVFLVFRVATWKYRPPRVLWDHVCLVDLTTLPPTPTPTSPVPPDRALLLAW